MKTLKVRGLYFSAGHRIIGHEQCYRPHGHTYFVNVTYVPKDDTLDDMGMIIDFGYLKGTIKEYLKAVWDHMTIISDIPKEIDAWTELFNKLEVPLEFLKPIRLTTAEYMQEIITDDLQSRFPNAHKIIVELFEGPMQGVSEVEPSFYE